MGFPDTFRIPVSDTQAYRQFGNSVVMREVARIMLPHVQILLAEETPLGSKQALLYA
ncbi:C-5 cytosine-specific DNA methylase [Paraburkholderia sp. BL21I4N1]|nr:C-5 cytosine-specific DNA methylase [Paraburkholderia sp. BL21I4N1]